MTNVEHVDVVVVGSGAGGMVTALAARDLGLEVLVVEKAPWYGGSSALSGGGVWVPNNDTVVAAGVRSSPADVVTYLEAITAGAVPRERIEAYVAAGPVMMRWLEGLGPHVRFAHVPGYSDYHPDQPGGCPEGRSVEPLPFDLAELGTAGRAQRRSTITPPAGMFLTAAEYSRVAMLRRTARGLWTALQVGVRTAWHQLRRRRTVALGQALVGRLRMAMLEADVPLWLEAPMLDLLTEDGRVVGIEVDRAGTGPVQVRARAGVVLASGGFERDAELRAELLPAVGARDVSAGASSNTGDGLRAGRQVGAAEELMHSAWWMPVVQLPDGKVQVLVSERCIPGSLVVGPDGERFVNECAPYDDFVRAQLEAGHPRVWLVMDARARARYPFAGLVPGQPVPRAWFRSGLAHRAETLDGLARAIGVPVEALERTVAEFSADAGRGVDRQFGRGDSAYDRYYGDPTLANPTMAPLQRAPYLAIALEAGDIGTRGGLSTDARARVLRPDGSVVPGLYATGNVAAPVMGESYAGPGATIGPAMTFGWLAAHDAAGVEAPVGSSWDGQPQR